MPSKAEMNRRRKMNSKACSPKKVEKLKYSSRYGVSDKILSGGFNPVSRTGAGGGDGFNAHYWIVRPDGKKIDPTPCGDNPPLCCKNGSVKPYYEEFTEEIQEQVNMEREIHLEEQLLDWDLSVEEYLARFCDPRPIHCYQNCLYYLSKHPECKMVCGAFGYIVDIYPTPDTFGLRKYKKYISLDYGY